MVTSRKVKLYKELFTVNLNKHVDVYADGIGWIFNSVIQKVFKSSDCVSLLIEVFEQGGKKEMKVILPLEEITSVRWFANSLIDKEAKDSSKNEKPKIIKAVQPAKIIQPISTTAAPKQIDKNKVVATPTTPSKPTRPICPKCNADIEIISTSSTDDNSKLVVCTGCESIFNMVGDNLLPTDFE